VRLGANDAGTRILSTVLLSKEDVDGDKPRWIQLAYVGQWAGHPSGPFKFTRQVFEQIVNNFREHPQYAKGEGGVGSMPVVAYDFDHASEMPPTMRADKGAPAQGWLLDLDIRQDKRGRVCLYGLSDVLEPAKSYIREKRLRWVSVAVHLHATDHITNKPIGAVISSVAFTNQPYLRGLEPLAASARGIYQAARQQRTEQTMTIEQDHRALLSALAVASTAEAAARVPVLLSAEKRVAELEKSNADLASKIEKIEQEKIEADVDGAMKSLDLHAEMRDALLLCRRHQPEKFVKMVETMSASKGSDARTRALTAPTTVNAAPPPTALSTARVDQNGRIVLSSGQRVETGTGGLVDIRGVVGPSQLARLICAVQQRNPLISYEEAAETALTARATGAFVDG